MVGFRKLDAFVKTRPDLQQKSAVGGVITLIAATSAALLFVGQTVTYILGNPQHSLQLSHSTSVPVLPIPKEGQPQLIAHQLLSMQGKIPLRVHLTFAHLTCDQLDVVHDGASLATGTLDKVHGKHSLVLRKPTNLDMRKLGITTLTKSGCTIEGTLRPQLVAGVLQITISTRAWAEATRGLAMLSEEGRAAGIEQLSRYNVSHYIHKIEFGRTWQRSSAKPLEERAHIIENEFGGIAVENIQVKLVPTVSRGFFFSENSYQTSVVDHTIQPATLVAHGVQYLPGLVLSYDFTPLTVYHSEGRDNFLVFLSSLISIVAGVFVTVGLLTGCLVHSASAVAKKID